MDRTRSAPVPIACSLTAGEARTRVDAWAALAADHLVASRATAEGRRLHYRAADGVAERLRALVAAERECCPFLGFDLSADPSGGDLVLDVTAVPEIRPQLAAMLGAEGAGPAS